jgi:hypothetical protein
MNHTRNAVEEYYVARRKEGREGTENRRTGYTVMTHFRILNN